eukprot:g3944.t1
MATPELREVVGWNAELGVFPFEDKLVYAVGSTVVVLSLTDHAGGGAAKPQSFLHCDNKITALAFSKSSFVESALPVSGVSPLIAVGCKKQVASGDRSSGFTELKVFFDGGLLLGEEAAGARATRKTKVYGPLRYHMCDIEQVGFVADGSKLISIEKNSDHTLCVWDLAKMRRPGAGSGAGEEPSEKPLWCVPGLHSSLGPVVAGGANAITGFTAMPVVSTWDNIPDFQTRVRYAAKTADPKTVDRSTRSEKTAGAIEQRYFHKVKTPGEKPPLRFVTWGVQSGTKFYSIDRRTPQLRLCSSKASFNCEEVNLTSASVENHTVSSCTVLSDGVHTLFGCTSGQVFFFEDACALRVFTPSVAGPGASPSPAGAPPSAVTALVSVAAGGREGKNDAAEVVIGLASTDVVTVPERFFFEEVAKHISIRGPSAMKVGTSRATSSSSSASTTSKHSYCNSKAAAAIVPSSVFRLGSTATPGSASGALAADPAIVSNPSAIVQGRKCEGNAFEVIEEEKLVEKDRSPRKKVLRNMERKAFLHRSDAKAFQSTVNDKKYVQTTTVVKNTKPLPYDYLVASRTHVFLVTDGQPTAVLAQPKLECTGICPLGSAVADSATPTRRPAGYAMSSLDGWLHFKNTSTPNQTGATPQQQPQPICVGLPVYSIASSAPFAPELSPLQYIAAGCATSKLRIYTYPAGDLVFQRSLGTSGNTPLTCCAWSPYSGLKHAYQLAVGASDGIIYLLTLGNALWTDAKKGSYAGTRWYVGKCEVRTVLNNPELAFPTSSYAATSSSASSGSGQQSCKILRGHSRLVFSVAFSECGNFLMSSDVDGKKLCFEAHSGQRLPSVSLVSDLKFSPSRYNLGGTSSGNNLGEDFSLSGAAFSSEADRPVNKFAPQSRSMNSTTSLSTTSARKTDPLQLHTASLHHSVLAYKKNSLDCNPVVDRKKRRPETSYTTIKTAGKTPLVPVSAKIGMVAGAAGSAMAAGGGGGGSAPRASTMKMKKRIFEVASSYEGKKKKVLAEDGNVLLLAEADAAKLPGASDCTNAITAGDGSLVVALSGCQQQLIYDC